MIRRFSSLSSLLITIITCGLFIIALFLLSYRTTHAFTISKSNVVNNLGLVGYWTFDGKDVVDGVVQDKSGNGKTGLLFNTATSTFYVAGKVGQGGSFFNSTSGMSVGSDVIGTGPASYCFWQYPFSRLANYNAISNGKFAVVQTTNNRWFVTSNGSSVLAGPTNSLVTNVWQYFCFTRDASGQGVMYKNGAVLISGNTGTPTAATTNLFIANRSLGDNSSRSIMDEVRLYNRVLSADEVKALYVQSNGAKQNTSQKTALDNGLILYWTFDGKDMTTGSAIDRSGNGNTGTLSGTDTSVFPIAGKIGQGGVFDGVNDKVRASSDVIGTSAGTYAAWIYPYSISNQAIISNGTTKFRLAATNKVTFTSNNSTLASSGNNSITPNAWNHVLVTRDASGVSNIYINGVLAGSANQSSGTPAAGATNAQVGGIDTSNSSIFNGVIDDVRIYNKILSASEVSTLYNQGAGAKQNITQKTGLTNGLVGYWTFDGKDMPNGAAKDVSGNGNTGYPVSIATSTFYAAGKMGQGANFDGVDDRIRTISDSIGTNAVSVSAWIYARGVGGAGFGSIVDNRKFILSTASIGRILLSSDTITTASAGFNAISLNKWYHITITRDALGVANFYINGVLSGTPNQNSGTPAAGTFNVTIGDSYGGGRAWNGLIDDVRVYNRILTAAEINQLYSVGK